ncbi:MAG: hypothetical protein IKV83_08850 [Muribaculaceae bacterium]|nr:hypothetical protein [Muribaculaceae bacterium]
MITPYSHIKTKEQLKERLKIKDDFISSIADNTAFIMNKCIDVYTDDLIVFSANEATVVGLFNKQHKLFRELIACFKSETFGISSILQRILYETFLKMLYLIRYGEEAQLNYRLCSYKNRYNFYIEHKDKPSGYFSVRNGKFIADIKHDGFTIDDIKLAVENKMKPFGGKNIKQLVAEFEDDSLYTSVYGISSDSIHSDWGDIHSLYLKQTSQEKHYVANVNFENPNNERYIIALSQMMLDSAIHYINWNSSDMPQMSCFIPLVNELKRISMLYSELVMEEYDKPNSQYYTK